MKTFLPLLILSLTFESGCTTNNYYYAAAPKVETSDKPLIVTNIDFKTPLLVTNVWQPAPYYWTNMNWTNNFVITTNQFTNNIKDLLMTNYSNGSATNWLSW